MTREEQMAVLARSEDGTPTIWCDPDIIDLVTALNSGDLKTVASCSGHGEKPGFIALADGRVLRLFANLEAARSDEALIEQAPRVGVEEHLETVAKALCAVAVENARAKFGNDELASTYGWQDWLPDARAAMLAMPKSDWFLGEVDCDGNELTAVRTDALTSLYRRACDVVQHDTDCEGYGRDDKHCTCDAVPFLRDLSALSAQAVAGEEE